MTFSIVSALALFLMMAVYVQSVTKHSRYCGGVKPLERNMSTLTGTCYVRRMLKALNSQSIDKCSVTIVTDKNDTTKGQVIDNENEPNQKTFSWYQVGSNVAQVILIVPTTGQKAISSVIYVNDDGDNVSVGCLLDGKTISDLFLIVFCTKSRNPSENELDDMMNKVKGMGLNTTEMVPVNQKYCKS